MIYDQGIYYDDANGLYVAKLVDINLLRCHCINPRVIP